MIDFTVEPDAVAYIERLERFIADHVVPVEPEVTEGDITSGAIQHTLLPKLRRAARSAKVYAPNLPAAWGGCEVGVTTLALAAERCGPHPLASLALNCMAPDEATMHLLLTYGDSEQQQQWLRPLADGTIRSCFGMTEPDAGSDPRRIQSTATALRSGGWRLDGHKVFTTGAIGAAFCVVMAVSEPDAPSKHAISMFIVPTNSDGFRVVRDLPTLGYGALGGHPEVALEGVEVGPDALLGERGDGLAMAQSRLGIGRLGHAMRWIGVAQRALDLMADYATRRETFGQPLAARQAVQWWLADGATKIYAARLMVLDACWRIEQDLAPRAQVSMIKTFVAETLNEVVDNALQSHGGWGYTDDFPFARWYRDARAARIYDGPSEVHRMLVARELFKALGEYGTSRTITGDPVATATRGVEDL